MNEKSELINPQKAYFNGKFKEKLQKAPGVQAEMEQKPDCGEDSYQGCNRLAGRKALVTGGDSGIGRAAAIAFAREGADVALNYFPSEEEDAEEVKKLIEKAGQKAVLLPGDLNRREVCAEIVEKAVDGLGGLDVLVLAAGRQTACPDLAELSDAQLLETFQVNVFSMFWTVKAALPHLRPVRVLLPLRRYRLISRASTCLIMRRPKAQSSVLRVRWPSSLPTAAFGRIRWRRDRFGRLCRFAAASCRKTFPSLGRKRRSEEPASRRNWLRCTFIWRRTNQVM